MTEAGGPSAFTDVESDWTIEEEEQTRSESDEDLDEDPDFVDLAYAQSEEDVRLLGIMIISLRDM
ncbi:PREDICTED: LOC110745094 [Prunus dulcis]|uniref:PREDICTED: LOC110745094 n=1 Tax=Prunus dulcis TaxID=3755 RepID=A0A5E4EV60_PRUDU|nr:PREDICTED: LOC110745094 [Prunus dulcis]